MSIGRIYKEGILISKRRRLLQIRGMYIEDLKEGELEIEEELLPSDLCSTDIAVSDAERALVGAGARALFYPRFCIMLLGIKFSRSSVGGIGSMRTWGWWSDHTSHMRLWFRHRNIMNFLSENASCGKTTYVHCKAGRGRSTTIVLCYLVQHKQMTPDAAFEWVRSIRQRVLLAPSQWHAVQEYHCLSMQKTQSRSCVDLPVVKTLSLPANQDFVAFDDDGSTVLVMELDLRAKKNGSLSCLDSAVVTSQGFPGTRDIVAFDDGSIVLVTESDLDGYEGSCGAVGNEILEEQSLGHRVQFASQTALARLSCLWLRSHARQKISNDNIGRESSCCEGTDQLGGLGVDIHVY
ncbi:hypothetical protein HHK36_000917 [Tetracentron sinense]|uniref:Tyrosine specific protein phosphatases domain-containing protein n=1 Tax=Tetracentron sinense TaxID=13715 RepID=A0A834ZWQ1_TETSI|nr:hypothetical protein HHK36_000917 [Tetracentron sinense]